jgi:hypothetical protein
LHPIGYGVVYDKLYKPFTFLFGVMPYKLLLTFLEKELGVKSDKYKFVGYLKENIGYYLYHLVKQKFLSQNMLPF